MSEEGSYEKQHESLANLPDKYHSSMPVDTNQKKSRNKKDTVHSRNKRHSGTRNEI